MQSSQTARDHQTQQRHGQVPSALRKGSMLLAGVIMGWTTMACGGNGESIADDSPELDSPELDSPELGAHAAALSAGGEEFKGWRQLPALSGATSDPALCTDASRAYLAFSRTTSGFLHGVSDNTPGFSSWVKYTTSDRKFATSPSCAMVFPTPDQRHFILAARGSTNSLNQTDKRLFWSQGRWVAGGAGNPPEAVTPWAAIDSNVYESGGSPAVASWNDKVVMTFLGDTGQIYAHYKRPSQAWSSRKTGPAMPAGWTAIGTPAIAFLENWLQKYTIVVLAMNNSNQFKFYYTFFDVNSFTDAAGGPATTFEELPLASSMSTAPGLESEPGLEWDAELGASTLYYRKGDFILQTSGFIYDYGQNGEGIVKVLGNLNKTFRSAPSVVGGVPFDQGRHQVLARDSSNTLWFVESQNSDVLSL